MPRLHFWFRNEEEATEEERAHKLLLQHLTPEQAKEYEQVGQFVTTGSDGRRYRVGHGGASPMPPVDDGAMRLGCLQPRLPVPPADMVLALKLFVESDVEGLQEYRDNTPSYF